MEWALDRDWCAVVVEGRRRGLSEQNYALVQRLVDAKGTMVGTGEIVEILGLHGIPAKFQRGVIAAHVRSIRSTIGPEEVVNIRGHGYALRPEHRQACASCGRPFAPTPIRGES